MIRNLVWDHFCYAIVLQHCARGLIEALNYTWLLNLTITHKFIVKIRISSTVHTCTVCKGFFHNLSLYNNQKLDEKKFSTLKITWVAITCSTHVIAVSPWCRTGTMCLQRNPPTRSSGIKHSLLNFPNHVVMPVGPCTRLLNIIIVLFILFCSVTLKWWLTILITC